MSVLQLEKNLVYNFIVSKKCDFLILAMPWNGISWKCCALQRIIELLHFLKIYYVNQTIKMHNIVLIMLTCTISCWMYSNLTMKTAKITSVDIFLVFSLLAQSTNSLSLISFYTPWKHQKTSGFLMFSGGIERDYWHEMG